MPAYAVLGATGNVGSAVLEVLDQSPNNKVHAFCRSKQKLLKMKPEIAEYKNVHVYEGSLDDTELLASCFSGTRAVFSAIAVQGNQPGCSIAMDTARNVIAAFELLKSRNERTPKLVVLSSASTDHRLMSETPQFLLNILYYAFKNIYDDLKEAEKFIKSKEALVSTTFIKPGALSDGAQKGHTLSLEEAKSPVSFLDLAAGMVEVADDESGRYDMKGVAVNATAKDEAFPWDAPLKILEGLIVYFLPWLYKYTV